MKDARLASQLVVGQYKPGRIPEQSAFGPIKDDPEEKFYRISFRYYRNDLCQIKTLLKNRGREGLNAIKKIGQSTRRTLYQNGINFYPVQNNGAYSILFARLPSRDVELKEHKLQGESRIFFFLDEDDMFQVIAITDIHLETEKHR